LNGSPSQGVIVNWEIEVSTLGACIAKAIGTGRSADEVLTQLNTLPEQVLVDPLIGPLLFSAIGSHVWGLPPELSRPAKRVRLE